MDFGAGVEVGEGGVGVGRVGGEAEGIVLVGGEQREEVGGDFAGGAGDYENWQHVVFSSGDYAIQKKEVSRIAVVQRKRCVENIYFELVVHDLIGFSILPNAEGAVDLAGL